MANNEVIVTEKIEDGTIQVIAEKAHIEIMELASQTGYSPLVDKNKVLAVVTKADIALSAAGYKWSQINWADFKAQTLRVAKTNINPYDQANLYLVPRKGAVEGSVDLQVTPGYIGIYNEDMVKNKNGLVRCKPFVIREGDSFEIVRTNGEITGFDYNPKPFNNEKVVGIVFLAYDIDDKIKFGQDFSIDKMIKDGKTGSSASGGKAWKEFETEMATRTAYNKFRKWFTFDNQDEVVRAYNELIEGEYSNTTTNAMKEKHLVKEQIGFAGDDK